MYVIKFRDIITYLARIALLFIIVVILTKYFFYSINSQNFKSMSLTKDSLTFCLSEVIPNIEIQENLENKDDEKKSYIEKILGMELGFINLNSIDEIKPASEEVEEQPQLEEAKTDVKTEIIDSGLQNKYNNTYDTVQINNSTEYQLTEDILKPNLELTNKKNIIIYHTHTCESYTPSEKYNYEQTGNYRTTDLNYSVVRVGREFANYMNNYGYNIIHDETYHDFPAYSGSYTRSLETISNILKDNSDTQMVIDLHRDAIGSNNNYAPKVKIGDEYAAQIMFVIGSNGGGLEHNNWQNNLKFAIKIQQKANEMYPRIM